MSPYEIALFILLAIFLVGMIIGLCLLLVEKDKEVEKLLKKVKRVEEREINLLRELSKAQLQLAKFVPTDQMDLVFDGEGGYRIVNNS